MNTLILWLDMMQKHIFMNLVHTGRSKVTMVTKNVTFTSQVQYQFYWLIFTTLEHFKLFTSTQLWNALHYVIRRVTPLGMNHFSTLHREQERMRILFFASPQSSLFFHAIQSRPWKSHVLSNTEREKVIKILEIYSPAVFLWKHFGR